MSNKFWNDLYYAKRRSPFMRPVLYSLFFMATAAVWSSQCTAAQSLLAPPTQEQLVELKRATTPSFAGYHEWYVEEYVGDTQKLKPEGTIRLAFTLMPGGSYTVVGTFTPASGGDSLPVEGSAVWNQNQLHVSTFVVVGGYGHSIPATKDKPAALVDYAGAVAIRMTAQAGSLDGKWQKAASVALSKSDVSHPPEYGAGVAKYLPPGK